MNYSVVPSPDNSQQLFKSSNRIRVLLICPINDNFQREEQKNAHSISCAQSSDDGNGDRDIRRWWWVFKFFYFTFSVVVYFQYQLPQTDKLNKHSWANEHKNWEFYRRFYGATLTQHITSHHANVQIAKIKIQIEIKSENLAMSEAARAQLQIEIFIEKTQFSILYKIQGNRRVFRCFIPRKSHFFDLKHLRNSLIHEQRTPIARSRWQVSD